MPSTDTNLRHDVNVDPPEVVSDVWPSSMTSLPGHPHRPVLEMGDLDSCSEWDIGRKALMAFITELDPQNAGPDLVATAPARWLYAGVLISVELIYGTPVIAIESGFGRTSIPLAQAYLEELRALSRSISSEVQMA